MQNNKRICISDTCNNTNTTKKHESIDRYNLKNVSELAEYVLNLMLCEIYPVPAYIISAMTSYHIPRRISKSLTWGNVSKFGALKVDSRGQNKNYLLFDNQNDSTTSLSRIANANNMTIEDKDIPKITHLFIDDNIDDHIVNHYISKYRFPLLKYLFIQNVSSIHRNVSSIYRNASVLRKFIMGLMYWNESLIICSDILIDINCIQLPKCSFKCNILRTYLPKLFEMGYSSFRVNITENSGPLIIDLIPKKKCTQIFIENTSDDFQTSARIRIQSPFVEATIDSNIAKTEIQTAFPTKLILRGSCYVSNIEMLSNIHRSDNRNHNSTFFRSMNDALGAIARKELQNVYSMKICNYHVMLDDEIPNTPLIEQLEMFLSLPSNVLPSDVNITIKISYVTGIILDLFASLKRRYQNLKLNATSFGTITKINYQTINWINWWDLKCDKPFGNLSNIRYIEHYDLLVKLLNDINIAQVHVNFTYDVKFDKLVLQIIKKNAFGKIKLTLTKIPEELNHMLYDYIDQISLNSSKDEQKDNIDDSTHITIYNYHTLVLLMLICERKSEDKIPQIFVTFKFNLIDLKNVSKELRYKIYKCFNKYIKIEPYSSKNVENLKQNQYDEIISEFFWHLCYGFIDIFVKHQNKILGEAGNHIQSIIEKYSSVYKTEDESDDESDDSSNKYTLFVRTTPWEIHTTYWILLFTTRGEYKKYDHLSLTINTSQNSDLTFGRKIITKSNKFQLSLDNISTIVNILSTVNTTDNTMINTTDRISDETMDNKTGESKILSKSCKTQNSIQSIMNKELIIDGCLLHPSYPDILKPLSFIYSSIDIGNLPYHINNEIQIEKWVQLLKCFKEFSFRLFKNEFSGKLGGRFSNDNDLSNDEEFLFNNNTNEEKITQEFYEYFHYQKRFTQTDMKFKIFMLYNSLYLSKKKPLIYFDNSYEMKQMVRKLVVDLFTKSNICICVDNQTKSDMDILIDMILDCNIFAIEYLHDMIHNLMLRSDFHVLCQEYGEDDIEDEWSE